MRRVVLTSTLIPVSDTDLLAFEGLDVEFAVIDGTDQDVLMAGTRDADAIIVVAEHITRAVIENMPRCRSITRFGIGVDTVDVAAATEHGIWVTNVPDANYKEVAVHAIAFALALSRRLPMWDRAIREKGWGSPALGIGIRRPDDQVFGILGLGRIGKRVAAIAAATGYTVLAHDPVITQQTTGRLKVELVDLDELVSRSDILSLHVPLTDSTRNILDRTMIEKLRDGAVVINVSRGGLMDETALADALRAGRLAGAGIDAFADEPLRPDSPLRDLDNVLLSPHAAHSSVEALEETRRRVCEEVARVLRSEPPLHPVNAPRPRSEAR